MSSICGFSPRFLVHDENARQLGGAASRVSALTGRTRPLDAAVALRRRHGDVARLDALVGLRHDLSEGVVRHQRIDDGAGGEPGDGILADTIHE